MERKQITWLACYNNSQTYQKAIERQDNPHHQPENPNPPGIQPTPTKPDENRDPTRLEPGVNEPEKNDPTRIVEPFPAQPEQPK